MDCGCSGSREEAAGEPTAASKHCCLARGHAVTSCEPAGAADCEASPSARDVAQDGCAAGRGAPAPPAAASAAGAAPQQGSPPAGRLGPCRRRSAPPAPRQGRLPHRQQQTALAAPQQGRLLRHQQQTAFTAQQQGRHALFCQQSAPAAPQQWTTPRRQPQRTPLVQGRPRRRPQPRPRPARRRPGALSAGGPRTRPPPRAAPVRLTRWRLRRLPRPRSATRGSRFPPRSLPYPTCMLTAEPGHAGAQRRSRGRVPCVGHAVCCDVGCGGSARLRELELEHLARTVQSAWCDAERAVGGAPCCCVSRLSGGTAPPLSIPSGRICVFATYAIWPSEDMCKVHSVLHTCAAPCAAFRAAHGGSRCAGARRGAARRRTECGHRCPACQLQL